MGFMAFIATLVLHARSQDSLLSVSVRRVHVVFPTAGFKGGRKPCPKTRETAKIRNCYEKSSGFEITLPSSYKAFHCLFRSL